MVSTSLDNIIGFYGNNSTVRMANKERVDTIRIGDNTLAENMSVGSSNVGMVNWNNSTVGIGDQLGISFGFSLSKVMSITIISLSSEVVGSGSKVGVVNWGDSSVEVTD